tara:strand:- start:219 stop:326 length:108 start_codon:yes stop_codon:yes gene_type:complete
MRDVRRTFRVLMGTLAPIVVPLLLGLPETPNSADT